MVSPNIHCIPLKISPYFPSLSCPAHYSVYILWIVLPFLPIILLSSFIQFPGKRHFQLCVSDCPQPAPAQLWGGDSWRKLHVAFPLMLPAAREAVSHSLAHRQGALLSLWLQETKRLKLRPIRRANHGVACGSHLIRRDVHGPMEVAGCWPGWSGPRGEWITTLQSAGLWPASSCEPLFL